ncbi:MAG: 50S ribosomal protein L18e [Conexivisphaerales archaeon]|nr:50S ribosomal protein L18e [Conexivisphaerales archaeon]
MNSNLKLSAEKALRKAYRETERPIWRALREAIEGASRSRLTRVNVGKINRLASDGDIVVVPGKVLGAGSVDKKLIVGALAFSAEARSKIRSAGGEALSIAELVRAHSDAKGVKLIGG